jgi:hypothetical protein
MKLGHLNVRPFVMVVPELPEKTAFIQAHLKSVGIEAEEFHCINALTAGLRTVHPYEYDAPGSGWNIGVKPVALLVSCQMFWCAAQYMPDSHFLFLEWDAKFHPDWRERTEQALRDVPPDFDFLFLGSCCCNDKPRTKIKGEVWEVKYPLCGHAVIIARRAMPTLLATQRKFYAPADISLAFHSFPLLKVYTVLPRVADQFDNNLPE